MALGSGWVAIKDKIAPPFRITGEAFVCKVSDVPIGSTHPFTVENSRIP